MIPWWVVLAVAIPWCILGAIVFYAWGLRDRVAREITLRKIAEIERGK